MNEPLRLMKIIAKLPNWWEVRMGPEVDEEGHRYLAACVLDRDRDHERAYDGLLFGISTADGEWDTFCRLLSDALERRLSVENLLR